MILLIFFLGGPMADETFLPSSRPLEEACLSVAMHHPELLLKHPHDPAYYHARGNRQLYETLQALAAAGRPVDMPSLYHSLGEPEDPEGLNYSYLIQLDCSWPAHHSYEGWVRDLANLALRRQVVRFGEEAARRARAQGEVSTPAELLSWLREEAGSLVGDPTGFLHPLSGEEEDAPPRASTGLDSLDRILLGGPQGGVKVVVMGRPGMGKTALMVSLALRQAVQGLKVGIFSLEMSRREVRTRMLSILSGVTFAALWSGLALDDVERRSLGEARERLASFAIEIDDQAALPLAEIESRALQLKAARGLDVLWIDHMGLVATKEDTDYRAMSKVSWTLKALAKTMKAPVFALHQMSRDAERRENPRPKLSDLRDSGKIEENTDIALSPFRPWVYDRSLSPTEAEIIILKHRNGPLGEVPVRFLPQYMEFREVAL
jgi:replicative DNA helicase